MAFLDWLFEEEPTMKEKVKQALELGNGDLIDYNADTDKNIVPINLLYADDKPKAKIKIYDRYAKPIREYGIFKKVDAITYFPFGVMICLEKRKFYWIQLNNKETALIFSAEKEEEIMPAAKKICYIE